MNVFQYASLNEQMFERNYAECGKERKTTFFSDLSIAEYVGGAKSVKQTYNEVVKSWLNNVEYFTEFVICLNHKIWQHYENNEPLARVYNSLWEKAQSLAEKTYKGEDLTYYYEMID